MKILIIGFGSAGRRHAMSCLQLGYDVSVWDPVLVKEGRLYDTLSERLGKENLTHAIVCSPPAAHFEQATLCIKNRLHTLVEKPLALTAVDGQSLVELAEEYGTYLCVACQLRYLSTFQKMREDFYPARNLAWMGQCQFGYDIRRWHADPPGYLPRIGVWHEVGSHELDLLCWLFGRSASRVVSATESTHPAWGDAPCRGDAVLSFDPSVVHLHLDYTSPLYQRNILFSQETKYGVWNLDPNRDAQDLQHASQQMLKDFVMGEEECALAMGVSGVAVLKLIEQIQDKVTSTNYIESVNAVI